MYSGCDSGGGFFLAAIFAVLASFGGCYLGEKSMQTEAVSRGVAKWEVTNSGSTKFKWLHEEIKEVEGKEKE